MTSLYTNASRPQSVVDKLQVLVRFARRVVRSAMHTHPILRCASVPVTSPIVGGDDLKIAISLGFRLFCPIKWIFSLQTRADRVLLLFSIWLGSLTVTIWLHAERSVTCCKDAAADLVMLRSSENRNDFDGISAFFFL